VAGGGNGTILLVLSAGVKEDWVCRCVLS